jgi:hypothetical protein
MISEVTISTEKLEYLYQRDQLLSALEAAGVDNWEGYDCVIESLLQQWREEV